jgi:hypothetical protein
MLALEAESGLRNGYPNGRRRADDVADRTIAMLSMGRVIGDGVGSHADLLDESL